MAHPETEAVEPNTGTGDPLDEIMKFVDGEPEDDQPAEEAEDELPEEDTDGEEPDEEADGEDDEAEEPIEVIKPPVSLNKEQQAAFKQLPPELQKVWADTEAQRNEQVRIKTTEAAEARRAATSEAQAAVAEHQRRFAAELEVYAEAFRPQEPDISLLATDPALYAQEAALYKQMSAQYQELMQRAQAARGEADTVDQARMGEAIKAEQARLAQEWPEILDPAKQRDLWQDIVTVGSELGFPAEALTNANATEMLALKRASEWKAKAAKWDAFQTRKMANVRAAKDLPRVAKPNAAPSRSMSAEKRADVAWKRAQTTRSGDAYADFLEASGIKL